MARPWGKLFAGGPGTKTGHYVSKWNRFWQRLPHGACYRGNVEALYNPDPMAIQDSSDSIVKHKAPLENHYPPANLVMALIKVS